MVGTVEVEAGRLGICETVTLVQPGMHQDDVSRARLALAHHVPVPVSRAEIGLLKSRERRRLFWGCPARRVHMQNSAVLGFPRLATRAHLRRSRRVALHAVWIAHRESGFVIGVRVK